MTRTAPQGAAAMSELAGLIADLGAEQRQLDEIVARLSPSQWDSPTPSPGWTVTDQIGHLCYFDGAAAAAIADPGAFARPPTNGPRPRQTTADQPGLWR